MSQQQELTLVKPSNAKPPLLADDMVCRIEAAKLSAFMLEVWQDKGWPKDDYDEFTRAHFKLFALVGNLTHADLDVRQSVEAVAVAIDKIPAHVFANGREMLSLCWRAAVLLRTLDPQAEFEGLLGDLEGRRHVPEAEIVEALQRRIDTSNQSSE